MNCCGQRNRFPEDGTGTGLVAAGLEQGIRIETLPRVKLLN